MFKIDLKAKVLLIPSLKESVLKFSWSKSILLVAQANIADMMSESKSSLSEIILMLDKSLLNIATRAETLLEAVQYFLQMLSAALYLSLSVASVTNSTKLSPKLAFKLHFFITALMSFS